MRCILKFTSENHVPGSKINKHAIQGHIYSTLSGTDMESLHERKGFKFFTFSDIFPSGDFFPNKEKRLIISSPNPKFIHAIYNKWRETHYFYLSRFPFKILDVKKTRLPLRNVFTTGSPIVLYEDNMRNKYFSFRRNNELKFFMDRLKENAVKKFNVYYEDEFVLDEPIFDRMRFKKEVAVKLTREGVKFIIIGSVWETLEKTEISREKHKFYDFIMDCGLGEKNSLGFGLVNPVRFQS